MPVGGVVTTPSTPCSPWPSGSRIRPPIAADVVPCARAAPANPANIKRTPHKKAARAASEAIRPRYECLVEKQAHDLPPEAFDYLLDVWPMAERDGEKTGSFRAAVFL